MKAIPPVGVAFIFKREIHNFSKVFLNHFAMKFLIILISFSFFYLNGSVSSQNYSITDKKIIVISVNAKGQAFIGKDTFDMEGLTEELHQRLWKSYLGTGKMQDEIKLEFTSTASSDIKKNSIEAVRKAQQTTLVDLSLQLHEKRFEDLNPKKQKKIKEKYPILFQQKFFE